MQNNNCSGIYIIRCKLTGRVYVGSSKNVNSRLNHHISSLRGSRHASWKLQEAWYEHGEDNFEFLLLEEVLEPELSLFEQKYIDEFNSFANGFNCRKDAIRAIYRRNTAKPKKSNPETIKIIEKLYSILPSTVSLESFLLDFPRITETEEAICFQVRDKKTAINFYREAYQDLKTIALKFGKKNARVFYPGCRKPLETLTLTLSLNRHPDEARLPCNLMTGREQPRF